MKLLSQIKHRLIILSIKFTLKLFNLVGIDFDRHYLIHQVNNRTLNNNLRNIKSNLNEAKYYNSCLPDRYSSNFKTYKEKINFLEYEGLDKWTAGNYNNNIVDLNRYFFLNLCIDYLLEENLNGDVAEVGVYKGNSAFLLAKYADHVNTTCYLFDTYEGFDKRDIKGLDSNITCEYFLDTSLDYVKQVVGEKNVVYVKGYFPESIEQVSGIQSFSLVHIDCDLEKPISDALNYFYPKMIKGGFLIMHDHSSFYWPGAKNAIDSFFKDKSESVIPIPDKSGTCVIRKM